ncbi:GtrA family protein [Nocardioides donggukensis]|uniref:GtrA family protein n=1 Tax=Nocardioides donggukensis TaxID=2774019 RepID=A0A927K2B8_9ACTN|nr:GtrA family protein [Nocardioides donggukensis]MBD8868699.1 GtrA family protein [Nocardioides donggukensis]
MASRRLQRISGEGARFLVVGALATLVSLVLFNVLVHGAGMGVGAMNSWPLPAFILANLVGMVVSYRGSRSWAFRHRTEVGPTGGRVGFLVVNLVSLVIPLTCLTISRYALGLDGALADNVAANVVGLGLGTVFRFWASRRYVFRRRPRRSRAGAAV